MIALFFFVFDKHVAKYECIQAVRGGGMGLTLAEEGLQFRFILIQP